MQLVTHHRANALVVIQTLVYKTYTTLVHGGLNKMSPNTRPI